MPRGTHTRLEASEHRVAWALGERAEPKRLLMSGTLALLPRESEGSNYRSLTQGKNVLEGMQGEAGGQGSGAPGAER